MINPSIQRYRDIALYLAGALAFIALIGGAILASLHGAGHL